MTSGASLMNLEQAAERLGCSVKTIRRRIGSGELRASRIARGRWVITDGDLQAFLDATVALPRDVGPVSEVEPVAGTRRASGRRRRAAGSDGRLVITNDMGRRY